MIGTEREGAGIPGVVVETEGGIAGRVNGTGAGGGAAGSSRTVCAGIDPVFRTGSGITTSGLIVSVARRRRRRRRRHRRRRRAALALEHPRVDLAAARVEGEELEAQPAARRRRRLDDLGLAAHHHRAVGELDHERLPRADLALLIGQHHERGLVDQRRECRDELVDRPATRRHTHHLGSARLGCPHEPPILRRFGPRLRGAGVGDVSTWEPSDRPRATTRRCRPRG